MKVSVSVVTAGTLWLARAAVHVRLLASSLNINVTERARLGSRRGGDYGVIGDEDKKKPEASLQRKERKRALDSVDAEERKAALDSFDADYYADHPQTNPDDDDLY